MSTTIIQIPSQLQDVEQCNPHLMPFHIEYTGTAPMSTYFKVEPAKDTVGGPEQPVQLARELTELNMEDGTSGLESQQTLANSTMSISSVGEVPQSTSVTTMQDSTKPLGTRFISSFRGRTIQGLKVDVPEGYVGVILDNAGEDGKTIPSGAGLGEIRQSAEKAKAQAKAEKEAKRGKKSSASKPKKGENGRATRSKSRTIAVEDDENGVEGDSDIVMLGATIPENEEDAAGVTEDLDSSSTLKDQAGNRVLNCTSQFSSFVLWHPDIPVDERRDDYYRALTEWTYLASEIHRTED